MEVDGVPSINRLSQEAWEKFYCDNCQDQYDVVSQAEFKDMDKKNWETFKTGLDLTTIFMDVEGIGKAKPICFSTESLTSYLKAILTTRIDHRLGIWNWAHNNMKPNNFFETNLFQGAPDILQPVIKFPYPEYFFRIPIPLFFRYNTFIARYIGKRRIGTTYTSGSIHGAKRPLYILIPVNRKNVVSVEGKLTPENIKINYSTPFNPEPEDLVPLRYLPENYQKILSGESEGSGEGGSQINTVFNSDMTFREYYPSGKEILFGPHDIFEKSMNSWTLELDRYFSSVYEDTRYMLIDQGLGNLCDQPPEYLFQKISSARPIRRTDIQLYASIYPNLLTDNWSLLDDALKKSIDDDIYVQSVREKLGYTVPHPGIAENFWEKTKEFSLFWDIPEMYDDPGPSEEPPPVVYEVTVAPEAKNVDRFLWFEFEGELYSVSELTRKFANEPFNEFSKSLWIALYNGPLGDTHEKIVSGEIVRDGGYQRKHFMNFLLEYIRPRDVLRFLQGLDELHFKLNERYIRVLENKAYNRNKLYEDKDIEEIQKLYPSFYKYMSTAVLLKYLKLESNDEFSVRFPKITTLSLYQMFRTLEFPDKLKILAERGFFKDYLFLNEGRYEFTLEAWKSGYFLVLNFEVLDPFLNQDQIDAFYLNFGEKFSRPPSEICLKYYRPESNSWRYLNEKVTRKKYEGVGSILASDIFSMEDCVLGEELLFDSSDENFVSTVEFISRLEHYPKLESDKDSYIEYYAEAIWKYDPYRIYSERDLQRILFLYDKGIYPFRNYYQLIQDQPEIRNRMFKSYGEKEPLERCYGIVIEKEDGAEWRDYLYYDFCHWFNEDYLILLFKSKKEAEKDFEMLRKKTETDLHSVPPILPYTDLPPAFLSTSYYNSPWQHIKTAIRFRDILRFCYRIRDEILFTLQSEKLDLKGPRSIGDYFGRQVEYKFYINGKESFYLNLTTTSLVFRGFKEPLRNFLTNHRLDTLGTFPLIDHFPDSSLPKETTIEIRETLRSFICSIPLPAELLGFKVSNLCPRCGSDKISTIEENSGDEPTRERYHCLNCGHTWMKS